VRRRVLLLVQARVDSPRVPLPASRQARVPLVLVRVRRGRVQALPVQRVRVAPRARCRRLLLLPPLRSGRRRSSPLPARHPER